MTAAAQITCYIQPTTGACEFMAWVDTAATAVVRREVRTLAEAHEVLTEARQIARAIGRQVAIKKLVTTRYGDRAPAGVKRLQGAEVIG